MPAELAQDVRWLLVERIARTDAFQKSSKLPALLRYLARCSLLGDRAGLTEHRIGTEVFGKAESYTPAEDSSVRVYVRQLRLRLHEYYQTEPEVQAVTVSLPKGSYVLIFSTPVPAAAAAAAAEPVTVRASGATEAMEPRPEGSRAIRPAPRSAVMLSALVCALVCAIVCALVCGAGWWWTAAGPHHRIPWPLNEVIAAKSQTTVVLADAGYSLRLLGDQRIPLDRYIDHSFVKNLLPEHMSHGESSLLHYLEVSQLTSIADAEAAATLSALAVPYSQNLVIRSAKGISASDLSRGNLIFVGAQSSNPWVQLFDDRLNFPAVEEFPAGARYILNRNPRPGEQPRYFVSGSTGDSGQDYATISLFPAQNGGGNILLIQGLRMEGTEAAVALLRSDDLRSKLQQRLQKANDGRTPRYFEVLLQARSVAGSPMSIEFMAVRTSD